MATLDNVSIDISVVLGRTAMPIHQVLRLGRGAIIELESSEEDEVRILANNMPLARGMVSRQQATAAPDDQGEKLLGAGRRRDLLGHARRGLVYLVHGVRSWCLPPS